MSVKRFLRFVKYATPVIARCALARRHPSVLIVGTPTHGNVGDQAIALAEYRYLEKLAPKVRVDEIPSQVVKGHERTWRRLASLYEIVLVQGGGFLGDVWPEEEEMMLAALEAFRDRPIVIMPQTLSCSDRTGWEVAFSRAAARCRDLTVALRERYSYASFRRLFPEVESILVPDMVLSLDVQSVLRLDDRLRKGCVLMCMRSDRERTLDDSAAGEIRAAIEKALPNCKIENTDMVVGGRIARRERAAAVASKVDEFSQSLLVVTDRLHGMVFSLLASVPCVVFDSSTPKTRGVYRWVESLGCVSLVGQEKDVGTAIEAVLASPDRYSTATVSGGYAPLDDVILARLGMRR